MVVGIMGSACWNEEAEHGDDLLPCSPVVFACFAIVSARRRQPERSGGRQWRGVRGEPISHDASAGISRSGGSGKFGYLGMMPPCR